ncbi:MAG: hypothetical protein V4561_01655 [Bacteroidota bacterium]
MKAILLFYKNFGFASNLITLACCWLLRRLGIGAVYGLQFLKAATLVSIFFFIQSFRKEQFYFYYNLCVSRKTLWINALLIDISIFILSLLFTYTCL